MQSKTIIFGIYVTFLIFKKGNDSNPWFLVIQGTNEYDHIDPFYLLK